MGCSIDVSGDAYRLYNGKTALTVAHGRLVGLEHRNREYLYSDPNQLATLAQAGRWEARIVASHLEMTSEVGPEGCQITREFYLGEAFGLSESIRKVSGLPRRLAPSIVLSFPAPASITARNLGRAPQVPQEILVREQDDIFTLSFAGGKSFTAGLDFMYTGHLPYVSIDLRLPRTLCLFLESRIAHQASSHPAEVFAQERSFQLGFSGQAEMLYPGQESDPVSILGVI